MILYLILFVIFFVNVIWPVLHVPNGYRWYPVYFSTFKDSVGKLHCLVYDNNISYEIDVKEIDNE